jgi:hypothetical protein
MSHGPMKMKPHNFSRPDGVENQRGPPTRVIGTVRTSVVSVISFYDSILEDRGPLEPGGSSRGPEEEEESPLRSHFVEDALEGRLQRVELSVDVNAFSRPILVLEGL